MHFFKNTWILAYKEWERKEADERGYKRLGLSKGGRENNSFQT